MSDEPSSEFESYGQQGLRRKSALNAAVKWVDWPGAQASTVTDVAQVFEHYLTHGTSVSWAETTVTERPDDQ